MRMGVGETCVQDQGHESFVVYSEVRHIRCTAIRSLIFDGLSTTDNGLLKIENLTIPAYTSAGNTRFR